MKTKKILAALLILAVLVSGFSTINASKYSDLREADVRMYNYLDIGDENATKLPDGRTYEITLKLDQTYALGGFLQFAADMCPDLIQGNLRISPNIPTAHGYRTIKAGTWSGIAETPDHLESIGYILHVV
jgi:hypothetical protein